MNQKTLNKMKKELFAVYKRKIVSLAGNQKIISVAGISLNYVVSP
jgi:hypothetical protein